MKYKRLVPVIAPDVPDPKGRNAHDSVTDNSRQGIGELLDCSTVQ